MKYAHKMHEKSRYPSEYLPKVIKVIYHEISHFITHVVDIFLSASNLSAIFSCTPGNICA